MPAVKISIEDAGDFFSKNVAKAIQEGAKKGLYSAALRMVNIIVTQIIPQAVPKPVDRGVYRAGWRAGQVFTWDGGGQAIRGLSNNVRQKNFTSLDIRLSKNFQTGLGRAQFFVDITNVLNLRHMYFNANARQPFEAFDDERPDWLDYMWSLHMPVDVFEDIDEALVPYIFIAVDDRPGDFRKDGVAFVPIEVATAKGNLPTQDDMGTLESGRRVLGWVAGTNFGDGTYFEYNKATGSWDPANSGFVDDVLDDRAYINMPNEIYRTFLNPRKFLFGIRVWF